VVAEARDLQEAVAALVRCEPDVVFVDLDLLGEDPSEPLGRLREARATTAIIVCATMERIGDIRRAGAAGASGAVERPFRHARLAEALERVR
jgi:DNA-binding NarL/FixJ family response regulator